MRRRNNQIVIRLNDDELAHLREQVATTELSQEAYIRMLITNLVPRPAPPLGYYDLLRELHSVGNNLNQLAHHANAGGGLDAATYEKETDALRTFIRRLQQQIEMPEQLT